MWSPRRETFCDRIVRANPTFPRSDDNKDAVIRFDFPMPKPRKERRFRAYFWAIDVSGRPDHLTTSEHSDRGCGEADSTADTGSSSRTRRRRCSVLHLSSLSRAPLDFEVSTPALPTFTADVGFVGEVPDPLRVSPSPLLHTRL